VTRDAAAATSTQADDKGAGDAFLRHAGRVLLQAMYTALRSLKLYPLENATAQKSLDELQAAGLAILQAMGEVEVRLSGEFIFVNATRLRLELDNFASFSNLLSTFRSLDIGALRVLPGIERREWQIFLGVVLSLLPRAGKETEDKERDKDKRAELLLELRDKLAVAEVTRLEVEPPTESEEKVAEAERAREVAKRTYSHGVAVTRDLINSVRLGRTTSIARVKRAVQAIVDQVLNNETSLVGLTTIRDYDEYTFTHSVNVCILAVALGKRLDLPRLQLYDLGLAALLHDVGKARVPLDVLNKTSGLTEEEWQLMQNHPWMGVLTLFSMRGQGEIPYRQIIVAHEHHMKLDLTGYPKAVRPRKMGIFSRIVAVADGYDAATTRRSYQTVPIQPDQVLREMWENPRRGYDPILVKALINLIGIYPVGTCVILDTFEVAIVAAASTDPNMLNRPTVRLCIDSNGALIGPPGVEVNLAVPEPDGTFARSIVKVTNPDRYGLVPGDYFV
jgi:HD-GYP domain-containing protein (c-di-GMP phosphodiesterase class II)